MESYNQEKFKRAKNQVERLKGFYIHLTIYLIVNAFILFNIYRNTDNFWEWSHFITLVGWGIGIFFHAAKTFNFNPIFNRKWEEKQIKKYMEEDKKEMDKYK